MHRRRQLGLPRLEPAGLVQQGAALSLGTADSVRAVEGGAAAGHRVVGVDELLIGAVAHRLDVLEHVVKLGLGVAALVKLSMRIARTSEHQNSTKTQKFPFDKWLTRLHT